MQAGAVVKGSRELREVRPMPIAVICPGCGDTYNLGDALAGRRCRCKGCGTVFRVPEARPSATSRDIFSGLDEGPAPPPGLGPRDALSPAPGRRRV